MIHLYVVIFCYYIYNTIQYNIIYVYIYKGIYNISHPHAEKIRREIISRTTGKVHLIIYNNNIIYLFFEYQDQYCKIQYINKC